MSLPAPAERHIVLDIEGMTCASCVNRIEKVLTRQPGVSEARVSLAAHTATLLAAGTDTAPLIEAVEKAGYGARLHIEGTSSAEAEAGDYLRRLVVAAVLSFEVLAFSLLIAPGSRLSMLLAWAFATPIQFYSGWPFLRSAARAARHGTSTMETLIAAGSLAAYGYSVAAVLLRRPETYFDTAAMIITLILLGKVLEARARAKAGDAARLLLEKGAKEAVVLLEGGEERRVPVQQLRSGDIVVVLPGEKIPADGSVRSGASAIDLSLLTGESVPVDVEPGDDVVGAAINGPGRLEIELTRVGEETRLAQIVRLLEITQASKAPIQRLADRISAAFVPRIVWLALATFLLRAFLGSHGLGDALLHAVAVLLIACPCSLGLATPAAIMAGSGRAAELGILFKGGEVFEAARRIDVVLTDKTGTLTEGRMTLRSVAAGEGVDPDELLALAAAAERGSAHPIARAVVEGAAERGLRIPESAGHVERPGAGVEATVGEHLVRVGRPDGLPAALAERAGELAAGGLTVFGVWRDGEPLGLLGTFDRPKPHADEAVDLLKRLGCRVTVVSGDREEAARAAARDVGVDDVVAGVHPEGKVEAVRRLQAEGHRVAFVGDGINDAPALAQADVGIALGTGTDVAIETGDILILGEDLRAVADSLILAKRTFRVIAQNLAWAFAYNVCMIPLAVIGVVSPLLAAGVMAGSSVMVVGNALRLRRYRPRSALSRKAATVPAEVMESEADPAEPALAETMTPTGDDASEPRLPTTEVPAQPLGGFARAEARKIVRGLGRLFEKQWEA